MTKHEPSVPADDDRTGSRDAGVAKADVRPPQRALAEAEERRRQRLANEAARPKEIGGRDGPDPVRFGDWEKGGIAWDF